MLPSVYRGFVAARAAILRRAASWNIGIASYQQPYRSTAMKRVLGIQREMLLTPVEAWQIASLVRSTFKLGGDMAEVGVYRGASAKLIRQSDPSRSLHLFDTFTGLPKTSAVDTEHRQGTFHEGEYACSLEDVREYLSECRGVSFYKGLFPATAAPVSDLRFSFVHSDVDIFESTKAVMEFFYPRMIPGGIILTHDFASCNGVHEAFMQFMRDKPEALIELPGDQALIVKAH